MARPQKTVSIPDYTPGVNDDETAGWQIGDAIYSDDRYVCTDNTPGAASWSSTTGGSDTDAIHDNVSGEINALTTKGTPTASDMVLIEDAADSFNKKKAAWPTGASGEANTASNLGAGVGVYETKSSVDLQFNSLVGVTNEISIAEDDPSDEIDIGLADNAQLPGTEGNMLSGGTTAQRPVSPDTLEVRRNTSTGRIEFYDGVGWQDVVGDDLTQTVTNKDLTDETNKLRHARGVSIEDPANGDRIPIYMNERAITVLGVSFASAGGTSVVISLEYATTIASGTVIHSDTCATSTPEWDVTPSGDATVPTDQIICLEVGTVTGSVTDLHVTFYYDED